MAEHALQAVPKHEIAEGGENGLFSDTRLELIRRQAAAGAPEDVFRAMIEIARARGLDPLAKQMSVIKFSGQWQITTTIDGYRAIAESTGTYAGSDAPYFEMGSRVTGKSIPIPEACTVTVWKLVGGERFPFTATVYWDEYYGGDNNFTWNKMPRTMLAKVAESHALRKAFPKVTSGIYTADEMDQASVEVHGQQVDRSTGEIRAVASPTEDPWERASRRLHAAASKSGIGHEVLHRWAAQKGYPSLREAPAKTLNDLAWGFEQDPQGAAEKMAKYMTPVATPEPEPTEATFRPINTAPPTDDEMSAAMDASTPASLPLDYDPGDPERFTR